MSLGPVVPVSRERLALSPITDGKVVMEGGFFAGHRRRNREISIPCGITMLEQSGTLENLRLAAGVSSAEYKMPLFRDSDLYKLLEAIAWERARGADQEHERFFSASVDLISRAQDDDGYLNSYVQAVRAGKRFADPAMGHELYCAGHLFQAAVADARTAGTDRPLSVVARRFATYLLSELREEQAGFVPGHPEIESALVELYRTLGDKRLIELADDLLERRGRGSLSWQSFPASYFQDDTPFTSSSTVRGHAVRALYLLAGATDLYTETGRFDLLGAIFAQWSDMTSTKTYLTGGVGSRHQGEAFGEAYELPPDSAYCETCAAIASVMWNWRLLLLTGDARYAELMERTLYNGFLSGVGLDGASFFYVNPLQARTPASRQRWFDCACCPPNVMRLLASLEHYLATTTSDGVQVHQYFTGTLRSRLLNGGPLELRIETDYPFANTISLRAIEAPSMPVEVAIRVPSFTPLLATRLSGESLDVDPDESGYLRIRRSWSIGDELVLEIGLRPRVVRAAPEIDGARGCVAFERGPLVYCVEGVDVPRPGRLDNILVDPHAPIREEPGVDLGGEKVVGLRLEGQLRTATTPAWPYHDVGGEKQTSEAHFGATPSQPISLRAIPYYAWANRGPAEMRVWIPEGR